ncbi:PDZ domain-containing protein [Sphingomonas lycopersici]|uniref:PDZ domain-containing protein n=1 Tax=Sphingomonas lycopersici TaxID=2951807 RepID=A0AA42CUR1_9SPHN|nr:PDZ domain-containing protein [Sphingomonas lycopersici]MCW6529391.1 PDZ domain-containing protein [Sphingomonas lycopersici]MCW6535713.1 PDZ domain-containing protein [Sphingomonas lycopersici]
MNGLRAASWAAVGAAAIGAGAFGLLAGGLPHGPVRGAVGGATYSPVTRAKRHVLVVTSLRTGGAEASAGLKVGDMIEEVNGATDASLVALRAAEARPEPTLLKVKRDGGDVQTLTLLKEAPGGAI